MTATGKRILFVYLDHFTFSRVLGEAPVNFRRRPCESYAPIGQINTFDVCDTFVLRRYSCILLVYPGGACQLLFSVRFSLFKGSPWQF